VKHFWHGFTMSREVVGSQALWYDLAP
jgi:hypothetical protein